MVKNSCVPWVASPSITTRRSPMTSCRKARSLSSSMNSLLCSGWAFSCSHWRMAASLMGVEVSRGGKAVMRALAVAIGPPGGELGVSVAGAGVGVGGSATNWGAAAWQAASNIKAAAKRWKAVREEKTGLCANMVSLSFKCRHSYYTAWNFDSGHCRGDVTGSLGSGMYTKRQLAIRDNVPIGRLLGLLGNKSRSPDPGG